MLMNILFQFTGSVNQWWSLILIFGNTFIYLLCVLIDENLLCNDALMMLAISSLSFEGKNKSY
jgi:hypothetical protein